MAGAPSASSAGAGRGLGRDFVITIAAQLAVAAGGLLVYRLLALEKGAEGMASYALVKQSVIFLFPAVALGLQTGVPRYVALDRDREGAGERYLLAAIAATGAVTAALSVALVVSPGATAAVLFGSSDRDHLVAPLVAMLAATLTAELVYGYYRGRSEFVLVNAARVASVAALPIVLLVAIPDEPLDRLIALMAAGVAISHGLLAVRPLARALASLRPRQVIVAARTLLDYGRRRVPGEYAAVILLTVPPILAAHFAPLDEVAFLTAGLYVLAVVTIAFQPVGIVFLPLLTRLCKDDFEEARRWVAKLAACSLHMAIFATPQMLLFADVAVRGWLGPDFEDAAPVVRITVFPVAMYIFYLVLRSALDAAAVKAYNSRNNMIALAVASVAAAVSLALDVGDPVTAIAASFALGILCLGVLTLASVHSLYGLGTSDYALRTAALLSLGATAVGLALRLTVVPYDASLPTLAAVIVLEGGLVALYLVGLVRSGVSWPTDIRDRIVRRSS